MYINAQEQEDHLFDEVNDLMALAIGNDLLNRDIETICSSIENVFTEVWEFS